MSWALGWGRLLAEQPEPCDGSPGAECRVVVDLEVSVSGRLARVLVEEAAEA